MTTELGPRAKPLTPEEAEQRREDMNQLHQSILATMAEGRAALWRLAAYLDLFDEQSGWSALGYEKLTHWLADPEVAMTRSRFHDLVDTYRELNRREIPAETMMALDLSKVRRVLPAVKQGRAKIDDAIDDVKALGWRDLREKYQDPAAERSAKEPPAQAPPQNTGDDTPTRASDGAPVEGATETDVVVDPPDPDDPQPGDPTGKVEPLDPEFAGADGEGADDDELDGLDDEAREVLEGTATETESVPAEPAQNPPLVDSGQLSAHVGEAVQVVEWLDMGINASSDVMRLNGMRKGRDFIAKVFDLPPADDARG